MFADGGTLPISQTSVPVQFDDMFKMFDAKTRTAVQQNLVGLRRRAGRARVGAERHDREPAGAVRASASRWRSTCPTRARELTRFFDVAERVHGRGRAGGADATRSCSPTWRRRSRRSRADPTRLEATIARVAVDARRSATSSLKVQQPFLADLTTFGQLLDAGDRGAAGGAAEHQPGDRGGHARRCARTPVAEREAPAGDGRAEARWRSAPGTNSR